MYKINENYLKLQGSYFQLLEKKLQLTKKLILTEM